MAMDFSVDARIEAGNHLAVLDQLWSFQKENFMVRRILVMLAVLVLAAAPASAQLEANLSSLGEENVQLYLDPMPNSLSAMLNAAIFRTGDVPKMGFNFSIDAKGMVANFDDDDREYQTVASGGFSSTTAPTVIGDTEGVVQDGGPGGASVAYPGGFDMEKFAVAVPQVSIGSVMGTRAIVRYIKLDSWTESDLGDMEVFGIGAQHSISQYFEGFPIDMAGGVMYQNYKIGDEVIDANTWAFNVTGSKKFGATINVEPYVGVGVDSFEMKANYLDSSLGEKVEVEFDRQNDLHLALGTGVNMPVVRLHAEYTIAAESGFAGGLSFGF
jgi:hypothetical protein